MATENTEKISEYNQTSFVGGMNLLLNDTHLESNQYRVLFNARNRYDRLDPIQSSVQDVAIPSGIKQATVTFGEYIIAFISGKAYYRYYKHTKWKQVQNFLMSIDAPRYWTQAVPIAQTNYVRFAATTTITRDDSAQRFTAADALGAITKNNLAGSLEGNMPGLVVQDNINQPRFIYLTDDNALTSRVIQTFNEWHITFTDENNTVVASNGDRREYVPIGNSMAFVDGILYVTSPTFDTIYRSVEGRPLDFVVNVTNLLAGIATYKPDGSVGLPYTQYGGGDASTTSYSVGVGGITCLRQMSDGSLFVGASNANFSVSKNMSNVAPKIFGEWTFIRKFLFNANCLSDRAILDSLGDTKFIDLTGVRSFNAIQQSQGNEGRNTPFTSIIKTAFDGITQQESYSAAILYDDYELYAVNTIFGPAIAVYDTINKCWVSFDTQQCDGKKIKQFVKIELSIQALYAITEDNCLYQLYCNTTSYDEACLRTCGICSNILYAEQNIRVANPKMEVKLHKARVILDNITEDCSISLLPYVNNRISKIDVQSKNIKFTPIEEPLEVGILPDAGTQLKNLLFSTPNCEQGWKVHAIIKWTSGSITQFSMELQNLTPQNPLHSQA